MPRVAVTVSGVIPADIAAQMSAGVRPLADYVALAEELDAELVDHAHATSSSWGRLVARLVGANAALALHCFRRRRDWDAILTDGEQVGLILALLYRFVPNGRRPRHVMIVHTMSPLPKRLMLRLLRLDRRIDHYLVYASPQARLLCVELHVATDKVDRITFMVDTEFFEPDPSTEAERSTRVVVSSAGLEFRDYPTLVEATRSLDVDVVVAAASPWSQRSNELQGTSLPANVRQVSLDLSELRQLYARSDVVVMPLVESRFQAGITTILEAMSMSKAIVCTRTAGQQDTLVHEETGLYVPPSDVAAMEAAIRRLVDDVELRNRLGATARRWVEQNADVRIYARRIAGIVCSTLE